MKNKEVRKKEDYQKCPKSVKVKKKCLRCDKEVKLAKQFFTCPRCRGYSEIYENEYQINL